jgi:hypothetical protein
MGPGNVFSMNQNIPPGDCPSASVADA